MQEMKPAIVVIDAMAGCLALHGLSQNDADDIEHQGVVPVDEEVSSYEGLLRVKAA